MWFGTEWRGSVDSWHVWSSHGQHGLWSSRKSQPELTYPFFYIMWPALKQGMYDSTEGEGLAMEVGSHNSTGREEHQGTRQKTHRGHRSGGGVWEAKPLKEARSGGEKAAAAGRTWTPNTASPSGDSDGQNEQVGFLQA